MNTDQTENIQKIAKANLAYTLVLIGAMTFFYFATIDAIKKAK